MAGYTGTFTSGSAAGHNMTAHPAVAAECETAGNSAYWSCSVCNKYFSDAQGNTEIANNSWVIAATGHTPVTDAAVAPTCTATGLTQGSHCSVCSAVITAQTVVPATGHTSVTDEAVAATCTSTGLTAGSHCSVCSAVIVAQTETPVDPTNHTNIVNDAAVAPTCTETGLTAGSHCAACDTVITAQTVVPANGHSYIYTDNGDGTHDVSCANCEYTLDDQTCVDENEDGFCDLCNAELACDHNYVGVVTTQPTKTATGVMTYTCSLCGDSYTEPIAIPELKTTINFLHTLNVSAVVADSITVSTKHLREQYGNGSTYFIDINYQTYSSPSALYDLSNAHVIMTSADKDSSVSTANKDVMYFKKMALYEMTLTFDMTIYYKNPAGVVVGYNTFTSTLAAMADSLADANTSRTNLLTCLADMCNYGKVAQDYFATANPTKDIVDAADPTVVLADYMEYASDISILPGAGEYDNTYAATQKVVQATGFVSASMTLNIGASNRISYTLRADNYELADCEIVMSYTSLYGAKEFTVDMSELTPAGTTSAGKQKYSYQFGDLAIYDANAVVTMSMYHNGVLECTSQYSIGYFVNQYVETSTSYGTVIRAMELFANSTAIQLGQGSIFG
jgi:hypothetical protein